MGGEDTGFTPDALLTDKFGGKLIKPSRKIGWGGLIETRATAFAAVAMQGELADQQDRAVNIIDAEIHLTVFIGKNTQVDDLVGHKLNVGFGVIMGNTQKNQQTSRNLTGDLTFDFNLGAFNSLNDCSHCIKILVLDRVVAAEVPIVPVGKLTLVYAGEQPSKDALAGFHHIHGSEHFFGRLYSAMVSTDVSGEMNQIDVGPLPR